MWPGDLFKALTGFTYDELIHPQLSQQHLFNELSEILYGLVNLDDDEVKKEIEEKKIILGGCIIYEDSPRYYCRFCNHYYNEDLEDIDERETEQSN